MHVCNTSDEDELDAVDLRILQEKGLSQNGEKHLDIYLSDGCEFEQINASKNTSPLGLQTNTPGINTEQDPLLQAVIDTEKNQPETPVYGSNPEDTPASSDDAVPEIPANNMNKPQYPNSGISEMTGTNTLNVTGKNSTTAGTAPNITNTSNVLVTNIPTNNEVSSEFSDASEMGALGANTPNSVGNPPVSNDNADNVMGTNTTTNNEVSAELSDASEMGALGANTPSSEGNPPVSNNNADNVMGTNTTTNNEVSAELSDAGKPGSLGANTPSHIGNIPVNNDIGENIMHGIYPTEQQNENTYVHSETSEHSYFSANLQLAIPSTTPANSTITLNDCIDNPNAAHVQGINPSYLNEIGDDAPPLIITDSALTTSHTVEIITSVLDIKVKSTESGTNNPPLETDAHIEMDTEKGTNSYPPETTSESSKDNSNVEWGTNTNLEPVIKTNKPQPGKTQHTKSDDADTSSEYIVQYDALGENVGD